MYSSCQIFIFFSFSKTRSKQHPWRLIVCVLLNVPIWNLSFSVEISSSSLSPQGLYNYGLNRGCWACRGLGPTFFFLKGWADRFIIIYIHSDFVQKHVVHLLVIVYINNITHFFSIIEISETVWYLRKSCLINDMKTPHSTVKKKRNRSYIDFCIVPSNDQLMSADPDDKRKRRLSHGTLGITGDGVVVSQS